MKSVLRLSIILFIALVAFVVFAGKVLPVTAAPSCSSPTVITGSGSVSVTTTGNCFKYVNTTFTNGALFSIMNGSTTASNTLTWYGVRTENSTSCINDSIVLSGNGAQLNNFGVGKDSSGAMYITLTGSAANTVSITITNWLNGTGCSVKPTAVSGGTGATSTTVPPTKTNTPVPTTGSTAVPTNTSAATATRTPTLSSTSKVYPAESAVVGGGTVIETTNGGFNGTGYANSSASGGTIQFNNVDGGSGGSATLQFRNALGVTTSRTGLLIVNGASQNITFAPTGAWTTWVNSSVTVTLNGGTGNTIVLQTNGQDLANIDEMTVTTGSTGPTATFVPPTLAKTNTPAPTKTPTAVPTKTNTPIGPTATTASGSLPPWPTATGSVGVSATIMVSGTFDGSMQRYFGTGNLGTSGQSESQDPIFELSSGATIKNVILGNPAADGIHCDGSCVIQNVWWEDVGEDAATFRGSSSSLTYLVDGGGAMHASDKVFQHNGAGTLTIQNFQVSDFGKLYRSCGNCSTQYQRKSIIRNIIATAPGLTLAGVNANYGDVTQLSQITIIGKSSMPPCEIFDGNNTGAEPTQIGSGADGVHCIYQPSDITYK